MLATQLQPRNFSAMSFDQLRHHAPSIFAEHGAESTSNRYTHIPTIAVVEGLIKEGFMPVKAMQSRTRLAHKKDYTKHLIRFRHVDATPTGGTGLYPEIVLINSHDGLSSYKLMSGLYRLICSNGLIAGNTYEETRVRHQGDIIGNVIEGTYKVIDNSKSMLDHADSMSAIKLNDDERRIFAEAAHEIRFNNDDDNPQKQAIKPMQFLRPRRGAEVNKPDLFTTFNVVQENIMKGGLRGIATDENGYKKYTTTREVKSIDTNTSLNRALWTLAEKMKELKS